MLRMTCSRENNASNQVENLHNKVPVIQQNEETELQSMKHVIEISSSNSSNESEKMHDGEVNSIQNMPIVKEVQIPTYADEVGNMAGESFRFQEMMVNSDNTMSGPPLFNNFYTSPIAKSSLVAEGNTASGICTNSLGGRVTGTSHVNTFSVDDDDSMSIAALLDDFNSPQADRSIINMEGNLAGRVQSNSRCDTTPDTLQSHLSGHDMSSVSNQLSSSERVQIKRSFKSVGGKSAAGFQLNIPHGPGISMSNFSGDMVNHNRDMRFATQVNNFQDPHIESSMSIGDNMATGIRALSSGTRAGIQYRVSKSDNVCCAATQSSNLQISDVYLRHMHIGGNRAAGCQANSQSSEINSSTISQGKVAAGVGANSNNKQVSATNTFLPDGISRSFAVAERNLLSTGANMPEVLHSHFQDSLMSSNNDITNEYQAYGAPSTEQFDNNFLNLGVGGNSALGPLSNVLGGGISSNGWPVATYHRPQAHGSFLSLGGIGNMGDQIRFNNGSRTICDTNAGANPYPLDASQRLHGALQQYLQRPGGRILRTEGNGNVRYANMHPNISFHGHMAVAPRPVNSASAGVVSNQQARLSRVAPTPSTIMGIPHGSLATQLQQAYANNIRSLPIQSHLVPQLTRSVQVDSGHHVQLDGSIAAQAAKETDLSARSKLEQTAQGTTHVSSRGKRGPAEVGQSAHYGKVLRGPVFGHGKAEGEQFTQSSIGLRGPSVSHGGKPGYPAGHVGAVQTQTRAVPVQPFTKSNFRPALGTLRVPQRKMIPQLPKNPSIVFDGIKAAHHLKWTGFPESSFSVGLNCQLCKRDLSYMPTGPVTQPSVPPAVAVLPCGHSFHDECLERITPAEESKIPPCIPCAIGTY